MDNVLYAIWEYSENNRSFSMTALDDYLKKKKYSEGDRFFASEYVKKKFYQTPLKYYCIDSDSYANYLGYKQLRWVKWTFWISVATLIASLVSIFLMTMHKDSSGRKMKECTKQTPELPDSMDNTNDLIINISNFNTR